MQVGGCDDSPADISARATLVVQNYLIVLYKTALVHIERPATGGERHTLAAIHVYPCDSSAKLSGSFHAASGLSGVMRYNDGHRQPSLVRLCIDVQLLCRRGELSDGQTWDCRGDTFRQLTDRQRQALVRLAVIQLLLYLLFDAV